MMQVDSIATVHKKLTKLYGFEPRVQHSPKGNLIQFFDPETGRLLATLRRKCECTFKVKREPLKFRQVN